ncbi:GLUG motif-containing protein [Ruminococcus bicirculans (ex Wegman et al. 2014)]|uniref:GLUG motif-containing protein n=1 Tax=Ruminococcus bicirculans (ex Wegman et al. 2014) TaxID=1160721 RepID=UPI003FD7F5A3
MKKKIVSLLVTGCLLFVPTTAFADDNKTVIKTVDDLLAFGKAVNDGDFNGKTDAVVVLDKDLDLTGIDWTPIGNVFNAKGELQNYFSGKFYGNGHTISNIDFTPIYGKDMLVGFFGDIEGAEVSGLTIEGNLNVTNADNDYTFYGTIAGFAGDCTISDCVSNVSFNNNGKYVYGFMGMVGQADGTTFEYCENTADITISGDSSSLYVGGIVGYAQNGTEVRYCSNAGDMVYAAANAGGIAGRLIENAKVVNSYVTGKLTPIGNGTTDVGGIVGSINGGSVSDCYFAGEIDLSQYSARKPYTRFGGIVGKDSSSTPDFKNNYFTETEDVEACGSNKEAGEAKAYDYMTTKEFYDELTANGAKYQYVEGKTPVLPTKEYSVDFEVTPADLKNVAIKVDGKEITGNTAMLTAGTYTVEVLADDCEPLSREITVSADIATHTQAFELAYKSADYTEVDKAEKAAKALNKDDYEDFSEVEKALAAIDRTKNITEQADVDAMVKAINDAVANLVKKTPASSQTDSSASDSSTADSKADSSSKAASNASNTNPSTGVAGGAFALALLSGAAVVMAKKKK